MDDYLLSLRETYRLAINADDALVQQPVIGDIYHLSWAAKRGMKWRLTGISGIYAYMVTPRSGKTLTAKILDLRETNSRIVLKAKRRMEKKAMY